MTMTTDSDSTTADVTIESASGESRYPYIRYGIDPRELLAQGNSRRTRDVRVERPKLVANVAKHGLINEVSMINVAETPDGRLEVLVGFHRHAAAVAVKELENPDLLIDVVVHAPGTSRKKILVAQGIENLLREGLTEAEEGDLFLALEHEGLDAEEIAEDLSQPIERVQAGRKVAANTRTRAAGEELPDVDLFVLAELAEFEDEEEVHQRLVRVLRDRPGDFTWQRDNALRERERRAKEAEAARGFAEQGYTILNDEDEINDVGALTDLCDSETTEPLRPEQHASCPGRAVTVWMKFGTNVQVTEYCMGYSEHGHRTIESVVVAAAEAKLQAEGVRLVDPDTVGLMELGHLSAEQDSPPLSREEHASCPGAAAYVDGLYGTSADVRYVCTDYAANGHVRRFATATKETRSPEWLAGERKRTKANNDKWEEAEEKRRSWLKKYFSKWRSGTVNNGTAQKVKGKKPAVDVPPPARLQHWLIRATIEASDVLGDAAPTHSYACELLGLPQPMGARPQSQHPIIEQLGKKNIGDPQALLIRLAQVLGACEKYFDTSYTRRSADHTWRDQTKDIRFYFRLLEFLGYPAQHIEKVVLNRELDNAEWPHLAPDTPAVTEIVDEPAGDDEIVEDDDAVLEDGPASDDEPSEDETEADQADEDLVNEDDEQQVELPEHDEPGTDRADEDPVNDDDAGQADGTQAA